MVGKRRTGRPRLDWVEETIKEFWRALREQGGRGSYREYEEGNWRHEEIIMREAKIIAAERNWHILEV